MTLASPKGGQPPIDPTSAAPDAQTDATRRFEADLEALAALAHTRRLGEIDIAGFDAIFYPGGHGPLWDLAEDRASVALIEAALLAGKPVAAVCHAPAVFRHAKTADGAALVAGRAVTGFTNSEEEAAGLTTIVPFLVEDMLVARCADFRKTSDWGVNVVTDGLLVTGQNPASSGPAAEALLAVLQKL